MLVTSASQVYAKIFAQVDQVEGYKAKVKTCDGAQVTVELLNGNTAFSTPFVEFQGLVTSASSLREESRTDFGANFGELFYNSP